MRSANSLPHGGEHADVVPRDLPRGPHHLGRGVVIASQRARMIEAMADAVAAKGFAAATVADVVARAGVSRKTFYEHFRDKEECFLTAYDAGVDSLLEAILAVRPLDAGWLGLTRARVRAYLDTLAAKPSFARTFMIEVFAAGPQALARRDEVHQRFEQLFKDLHANAIGDYADLPEVPDELYTAAVGATNELVSRYVAADRTARLGELEDRLVDIHIALLLGRRGACPEVRG